MIELHLLLLFMIIAAIIAVRVNDLLSGVVAIGAVGIGLSMAFLVLRAPELAIMQLVVEILSLIILIRATIRKDVPFSASGRWVFNTLSTLAFVAAFLAFAYLALKELPPFGEPLAELGRSYIDAGSNIGFQNVVSAISLNFRAYDTLGGIVVIFTALVGVLAIARRVGHSGEGK